MTAIKLDGLNWQAHAHVDKFTIDQVEACRKALGLERDPYGDELRAFCTPDSFIDAPGNALTNAGLTRITNLIIGTGSTQAATNTSSRIGVGDSTTTFATSQTDLQASTNKYFKVMDSTYPSVSVGVITFKSTFATGDANFAWQEWGVDIGTPTVSSGSTVNATLLNRKVTSLGTKTSAASWAFTVTITLS